MVLGLKRSRGSIYVLPCNKFLTEALNKISYLKIGVEASNKLDKIIR